MKALIWHGKHDIRCESVPTKRQIRFMFTSSCCRL